MQGYAEVVGEPADRALRRAGHRCTARVEAENEQELDHRDLRALTLAMLDCYRALAGRPFPADPHEQLDRGGRGGLSFLGRAQGRKLPADERISDDAGTAVTVQTMVFGNAGGESGAGVGFTRNPATGARELYFDFQFNGQGEDVVAGRQKLRDNDRLRLVLPAVWIG